MFKKIHAVLLAAIMIVSMAAITVTSAFAAEPTKTFTLETTSNFFPSDTNTYSNLDSYEDENGDVFVSVEYQMKAPDKYLINVQMDELTWDPNVLEFKEAYNKVGKGKSAKLNVFAFAVTQGQGTGVVNTFDDTNAGRIVGNYTQIMNPALAYDMDDDENYTPVTVVKAVFKVLDRDATKTTVNCVIHTLSLDDDDDTKPRSKYSVVDSYFISDEYTSLYANTTDVTPEGDVNPVTPIEEPTQEVTDAPTEPVTDAPATSDEPVTTPVTEPVKTDPVETPTDAPVTQPATEPVTEPPVTEPVTDAPVETTPVVPVTEPVTEPPVTEPVTDAPVETTPVAPVTEPATEPATNAPTEPVTNAPAETVPVTDATQATATDTTTPTDTDSTTATTVDPSTASTDATSVVSGNKSTNDTASTSGNGGSTTNSTTYDKDTSSNGVVQTGEAPSALAFLAILMTLSVAAVFVLQRSRNSSDM